MSVRNRAWSPKLRTTLLASALGVADLLVSPVVADDQYDTCLAKNSSNADWMVCGVDYLIRMDDQLNEAWAYAFPALTDEGKALLRTEQRAWNTFKEASCSYYMGGDYGREGEVLHFAACQGMIIEQRIDYLNELGDFATGEGE